MTRARTAIVLAVVAVLAVLATGVVAVVTREDGSAPTGRPRPSAAAGVREVADPASGARFEVPASAWKVRGEHVRIYYDDARGRPAAVVRGPAVFRPGYCDERPEGSYRAFAGFTQQPFETWLSGLAGGQGRWTTGESRDPITLADGTRASVRWIGLLGDEGTCDAGGIELAMVRTGGVRLVLVADTGEPGTLTHEEVLAVLGTLDVP